MENGFVEHWMVSESERAVNRSRQAVDTKTSSELSVDQIQTFFYLLIIGNIASALVISTEIIFFMGMNARKASEAKRRKRLSKEMIGRQLKERLV